HAHAEFYNAKRLLSFDLCYGIDLRGNMYQYLLDNGLTQEEYYWFMETGSAVKPYCIMGNEYYVTNEHAVRAKDGLCTPSGLIYGYYVITKQYYDRYHLPVMHTETNLMDANEAPAWLRKE